MRARTSSERHTAQTNLFACAFLSACLILPASIVAPALAIICATLAVECVLGAIYAARVRA